MHMSRWVLDESKFLSTAEVRRLLKAARGRAEAPWATTADVRDYLIVDLALSTGLRVGEVARLKCGDLFVGDGTSSLIVRRGKGGRPRSVVFNGALRGHLLQHLGWKERLASP